MRLAGRIILEGSYNITAPVAEQIMLFLSLVSTEQVRFHELNFNPVGFVVFSSYLQLTFCGASD